LQKSKNVSRFVPAGNVLKKYFNASIIHTHQANKLCPIKLTSLEGQLS